jgi:serine/threonine protein kinase
MDLRETLIQNFFYVKERAGEDAYCDFWNALTILTEHRVLLKVVKQSDSELGDKKSREFEKAIRRVYDLFHSSIARVLTIDQYENHTCIGLEFTAGDDLQTALGRGRLPLYDALYLAIEISKAVKHAHQRNVIHQYLGPEVIRIISTNEAVQMIKITGFDLAPFKILSDGIDKNGNFTAFMAPELVSGNPTAEAVAQDIYSIGALLYWMLTGAYPYVSSYSVKAADFRGVSGTGLVVPSKINDSVPTVIDDIVVKLLMIEPGNRFTSVDRFLSILINICRREIGYEFVINDDPPPVEEEVTHDLAGYNYKVPESSVINDVEPVLDDQPEVTSENQEQNSSGKNKSGKKKGDKKEKSSFGFTYRDGSEYNEIVLASDEISVEDRQKELVPNLEQDRDSDTPRPITVVLDEITDELDSFKATAARWNPGTAVVQKMGLETDEANNPDPLKHDVLDRTVEILTKGRNLHNAFSELLSLGAVNTDSESITSIDALIPQMEREQVLIRKHVAKLQSYLERIKNDADATPAVTSMIEEAIAVLTNCDERYSGLASNALILKGELLASFARDSGDDFSGFISDDDEQAGSEEPLIDFTPVSKKTGKKGSKKSNKKSNKNGGKQQQEKAVEKTDNPSLYNLSLDDDGTMFEKVRSGFSSLFKKTTQSVKSALDNGTEKIKEKVREQQDLSLQLIKKEKQLAVLIQERDARSSGFGRQLKNMQIASLEKEIARLKGERTQSVEPLIAGSNNIERTSPVNTISSEEQVPGSNDVEDASELIEETENGNEAKKVKETKKKSSGKKITAGKPAGKKKSQKGSKSVKNEQKKISTKKASSKKRTESKVSRKSEKHRSMIDGMNRNVNFKTEYLKIRHAVRTMKEMFAKSYQSRGNLCLIKQPDGARNNTLVREFVRETRSMKSVELTVSNLAEIGDAPWNLVHLLFSRYAARYIGMKKNEKDRIQQRVKTLPVGILQSLTDTFPEISPVTGLEPGPEVTWFNNVNQYATELILLLCEKEKPLLVIVSDLHLVDKHSYEILRFITYAIKKFPLFIVGFYRETGDDSTDIIMELLNKENAVEG